MPLQDVVGRGEENRLKECDRRSRRLLGVTGFSPAKWKSLNLSTQPCDVSVESGSYRKNKDHLFLCQISHFRANPAHKREPSHCSLWHKARSCFQVPNCFTECCAPKKWVDGAKVPIVCLSHFCLKSACFTMPLLVASVESRSPTHYSQLVRLWLTKQPFRQSNFRVFHAIRSWSVASHLSIVFTH